MSAARALVIAYEAPPHDLGVATRRVMDHVESLREAQWDVTFVGSNRAGDKCSVLRLEQLGVTVHDGPSSRMENLFGAGPFELAILADWPIAELYLPMIRKLSPRTRVVVDAAGSCSFVHPGACSSADMPGAIPEMLTSDFADQLIGELNVYLAADGVLSVEDSAILQRFVVPVTPLFPLGVSAELPRSPIRFESRRGVLYVGDFSKADDAAALEVLCRNVLPRVDQTLLQEHPIFVVGPALDGPVTAVAASTPNVRLIGDVPSLLPYLERVRAAVVPSLATEAHKRQLTHLLMVGTPAITTSEGLDELQVREGDAIVAASPDQFGRAIGQLLAEEHLWNKVSGAGRDAVLARYARGPVRESFLDAVAAISGVEPKPPVLPESHRHRYRERLEYGTRSRVSSDLRNAVRRSVPPGSTVLVVSKGDDALLRVEDRAMWHFPRLPTGEWAGYHPADSDEAISGLEEQRSAGADHLLIPQHALWWLDYYDEFREHLRRRYQLLAEGEGSSVLYKLRHRDPDELSACQDLNGPRANGVFKAATSSNADGISLHDGSADPSAQLIAFLLPQYHPIPQNDEWWGKGFTEWTNVAKAKPLFPGHRQPHLPADLGFYDLRLPEARAAQAHLAREYGISGFCYYHYWFGGARLLERPFNAVLDSGEPEFPFCLCWANEPWSRRWDGSAADTLQPQNYSHEDDVAHIRSLLPAFADPRAIRVGGRPMFLVYRADQLPDPVRTTDVWREEVEQAGLPGLHLVAVETSWDAQWDATAVGFDAKVLFQPRFPALNAIPRVQLHEERGLRVWEYTKAWPLMADVEPVSYRRYDSVSPGWDNTARTGYNGLVLHDATPEAYEQWLRATIARAQAAPPEHRIVFINAWNEWAEGCHLEPDRHHGRKFLESTRSALYSSRALHKIGNEVHSR